jgi:hypothetical protein
MYWGQCDFSSASEEDGSGDQERSLLKGTWSGSSLCRRIRIVE